MIAHLSERVYHAARAFTRWAAIALVFACAASGAQSQSLGPEASGLTRPTVPQQIAMGVGGHFGGGLLTIGGLGLAANLTNSLSASVGFALALTLYPLGNAAASYGIGRAFDTEGMFKGTLRGAYIGSGFGLVVAVPVTLLLLERISSEDYDGLTAEGFAEALGEVFGALAVGALIYIGGTSIGSVRGYNASIQPTAMQRVEGGAVPGLRLTLQF